MDIIFKCQHCEQELSVDESGAGAAIECPSCGQMLLVPHVDKPVNPIASSAAAKEEKHFKVPTYDASQPVAPIIEKAHKPLEVAAKETDRKLRIKTIRHSDHIEVGKDLFDEHVSQLLQKIGEANIVSITPISYTHMELASRQWITDYGVLLVYRG